MVNALAVLQQELYCQLPRQFLEVKNRKKKKIEQIVITITQTEIHKN